jgi:hypothetical protein
MSKTRSELAIQIASSCWQRPTTSDVEMDVRLGYVFAEVVEQLIDRMEYGWSIIANVSGGDWEKQSEDWQKAAAKFRDECWDKTLAAEFETKADEVPA